jgi:hypothetical protein
MNVIDMKIMTSIFGIIFRPSKTLDYLIREKPIIVGIIIWAISAVLYLYALTYIIGKIDASSVAVNWYYYLSLLLQPKHFLKIFGLFLYVYVQNFTATKYFKLESHYIELLSCSLFILIIDVLSRFSAILFALTDMASSVNYLNIPFVFWASYLTIAAIAKVYDTTVKKGIYIFIISIAFMTLLLLIGKQIYV